MSVRPTVAAIQEERDAADAGEWETSGILDVSTPASPVEWGFFDTVPATNATLFGGSWSNYPFFDSGVIAVTSSDEGLFLLRLQS